MVVVESTKVFLDSIKPNQSRPLISVVIPTCNRKDQLRRCLDCIAPEKQKLSADQYQVMVSDDGDDDSAAILIQNEFPWVRWTRGSRRGPAANRNNGVMSSTGDWLVFTDDDCLPGDDWLMSYIAAMKADRNVLEGRTICSEGLPSILYEAPINESGNRLWSCNFAIRRDVFFDIGGFDERFPYAASEDEEFRERLKRFGLCPFFTAEAVVDHPPRRRPFGRKWHKRWKCQVLKEAILENTVCTDRLMPLRIGWSRIRELTKAPSFKEGIGMVASAIIECTDIACSYRAWKHWASQEIAKGPSQLPPSRY